jgi:hypothetical protein
VQCSAVQCSAVQYSAVQCSAHRGMGNQAKIIGGMKSCLHNAVITVVGW